MPTDHRADTELGETDLAALLRHMSPRLHAGRYVYTRVTGNVPDGLELLEAIVTVREEEGITLVLPEQRARELELPFRFVAAWITLEVHSALEAIGLTAAVSAALTEAGLSANVVAGFTHDHLFVLHESAEKAMAVLRALSSAG